MSELTINGVTVNVYQINDGDDETVAFNQNEGDSELPFVCFRTESSLIARQAIEKEAPKTYHELLRGTMKLAHRGAGIWFGKVSYGGVKNKIQMTLELPDEKVKRMKSLETIADLNLINIEENGPVGPSYGGLIGVSKDKIEGVDVHAKGMFRLQMQWSTPWGTLDPAYINTCRAMKATVNDSDVILKYKSQELTFKKGELLFTGGTFHDTSNDGCDCLLRFEGIDNEDDITIGERDGSDAFLYAPIAKEGHHYLWLRTRKQPSGMAEVGDLEVPQSAHIERVYGYADFSKLKVFDVIKKFDKEFEKLLDKEEEDEALFEGITGLIPT